jgi:ABC-type amino acid transport system permease subunit
VAPASWPPLPGFVRFTPFWVDPAAVPAYLQGMSDVLPAAASRRAPRRLLWPLMAAAVVVGGLMAVAVALWLHYGTAVFFEIVRAGIAACL